MKFPFILAPRGRHCVARFRREPTFGTPLAVLLRATLLWTALGVALCARPASAQAQQTAPSAASTRTGNDPAASAATTTKERKAPPEIPFVLRPAPKIGVLTFGPGDAAFLKFGHNAIRVQDLEEGTDLVYNFGTFRFDNPFLILDFLTGKFQYWVSVTSFRRTVEYYEYFDRDVVEQQLNVGHQAAHDIANALRENAKPENRYYVYDYYRDNCSTRVRDVIDTGLEGAIERRSKEVTQMTLRDHTLRAVADDFWLYLGLDIAMGAYIDQPETRYSEMFLPEKLHDGLERIVFSGVHGSAPLVKERKVWYKSSGKNKLHKKPPERTLAFLKGGLVLAGFLSFLGWEAYRRRKAWAKALLSLLLFAYGLATGVLGCLFLGLWFLTDHVVAYKNENILQCAPWGLALAVCAWGVFRDRPMWIERAYKLTFAAAVLAALGLLLKAMPGMIQQNYRIIALLLPTWGGFLFALSLLRLQSQQPLLIPVETKDAPPVGDAAPDEEPSEEPKPKPKPKPKPARPSVAPEKEDKQANDPPPNSVEPVPA